MCIYAALIHIVVLAGLIVATRVVPHAQNPTLTVVDAATHDPSRSAFDKCTVLGLVV